MEIEKCADSISSQSKSCEEVAENCKTESETVAEIKKEEEVTGECDAKDYNVYSYVQRDEHTCEKFKVEISNLPKYVNYSDLKKVLVNKIQLKPQKIKLIGSSKAPRFAFVAFKSEEEREAAIEKCNDYEYKGCKLCVKKANPAPDPLIEKRKREGDCRSFNTKKQVIDTTSYVGNIEEHINDQVTPLWRMDYEEQLLSKSTSYEQFLVELYKDIGKIDRDFGKKCPLLFKWWKASKAKFKSCCQLQEIKRSPVIFEYRNKCEFNIGVNKAVGFRLGLYKDGNVTVVTPPENCPILSKKMREVISAFENYLKKSSQPAFNNENNSGFWRQLTVRTSVSECMLIVDINPGDRSDKEVHQEMEELKEFLEDNCTVAITSFYLHPYRKRETVIGNQSQLKLISGNEFISETMIDKTSETVRTLNFRISPFAFFQVNTAAAEVCYEVIADLARLTQKTVLLDVCCGTGTIGLYLSSRVKHVIGIELNEDAVNDCRKNATDNHIDNIEFICGKAENVMGIALFKAKKFINEDDDLDLVCVIDPPRAGLNNSIVKLIRSTSAINRFVYVSCEPRIARRNLIDFCRPPSKQYQGLPFVPISAVPVDMFPHTKHCELLLLYERLNEDLVSSLN